MNVHGVTAVGRQLDLHNEPLVVGFLRGLEDGQDITDHRVGDSTWTARGCGVDRRAKRRFHAPKCTPRKCRVTVSSPRVTHRSLDGNAFIG